MHKEKSPAIRGAFFSDEIGWGSVALSTIRTYSRPSQISLDCFDGLAIGWKRLLKSRFMSLLTKLYLLRGSGLPMCENPGILLHFDLELSTCSELL